MCNKIFAIMSNNLGDPTSPSRQIIHFSGCGSLENFMKHLIRNDCKDFDIDMIEKLIHKCNCKIIDQEGVGHGIIQSAPV